MKEMIEILSIANQIHIQRNSGHSIMNAIGDLGSDPYQRLRV